MLIITTTTTILKIRTPRTSNNFHLLSPPITPRGWQRRNLFTAAIGKDRRITNDAPIIKRTKCAFVQGDYSTEGDLNQTRASIPKWKGNAWRR